MTTPIISLLRRAIISLSRRADRARVALKRLLCRHRWRFNGGDPLCDKCGKYRDPAAPPRVFPAWEQPGGGYRVCNGLQLQDLDQETKAR